MQGAEIDVATGWVQRTTSADTTSISVDIEGVAYAGDKEDGLLSATVVIEVQYCPTGTGTWTTMVSHGEQVYHAYYWSLQVTDCGWGGDCRTYQVSYDRGDAQHTEGATQSYTIYYDEGSPRTVVGTWHYIPLSTYYYESYDGSD